MNRAIGRATCPGSRLLVAAHPWHQRCRQSTSGAVNTFYTKAQEALVHVCLHAGRSRARKLGLSWRWRHLEARHCVVEIKGNSRSTDLLGYRLQRDLPLVAEGCVSAALSPSQLARIGRGFADLMLRGRHIDGDAPMVLRGVTKTRF